MKEIEKETEEEARLNEDGYRICQPYWCTIPKETLKEELDIFLFE